MTALLEVDDLRVAYGDVAALRGVSFSLGRGECVGVAGESGSGKSTLALCLAGLVPPSAVSGRVLLDGEDVVRASPERLQALRWAKVALAPQAASFNPVVTVGAQVCEPLRVRAGVGRREARRRAALLAADVQLDPSLLNRYPHQLSGGERRRALLAMALSLDPELLVLDEPTAGLDPSGRRDLMELLRRLTEQRSFGLIVLSHDLPDLAGFAERMMLLYAGEVMESGKARLVASQPSHPYTWALVNAHPVMSSSKDLRPIRGVPPDPRSVPSGCPYHPRCTQAEDICREQRPPLVQSRDRQVLCHFGGLKTLLAARSVQKHYRVGRTRVNALHDISLTVAEGESVGVIGASGSGKSTLARILTGHLAASGGDVMLEGQPLTSSAWSRSRMTRRRVQLIMQDPWDALSARLGVADLVYEPMVIAGEPTVGQRQALLAELLHSVGLPSRGGFLRARAHQLSGGQLQRVALARALAASPKILVADEPTSMLDASEQARMLVVLRERQIEMGLGLILISHDIAVVRKVTDRIIVLDAGTVVEEGPSHLVSSAPRSAAARRLLFEAPTLPSTRSEPIADGIERRS